MVLLLRHRSPPRSHTLHILLALACLAWSAPTRAQEPSNWKLSYWETTEYPDLETACVARGIADCGSPGTTCYFPMCVGAIIFPWAPGSAGAIGGWCARCGGTETVARFCPEGTYWDGISRCKCPYAGQWWNPATRTCVRPCPPGTRGVAGLCLPPRNDPRNNGEQCPAVGNPINPGAGVKFQMETIYQSAVPGGLRVTMAYNSSDPASGYLPQITWKSLGTPWVGSYQSRAVFDPGDYYNSNIPRNVSMLLGDGRVEVFTDVNQAGAYIPEQNVTDRLVELHDATRHLGWRLTLGDEDELQQFHDPYGSLLMTITRQGVVTRYGYSDGTGGMYYDPSSPTNTSPFPPGYVPPACTPPPGFAYQLDAAGNPVLPPSPPRLVCLEDHWGRQFHIQHDARGHVRRMMDPEGGIYQFFFDGPSGGCVPPAVGTAACLAENLTSIIYPDNTSRVFHYNEPALINGGAACPGLPNGILHALTGITDESGNRFATWEYDCQGRATSSQHAGGADHVTLAHDTPAPGQVTVTTAVGTGTTPATVTRAWQFADHGGQLDNSAIQDMSGTGGGCAQCGDSAARTFDARGYVAGERDWNGHWTCYARDAAGLETVRLEGITGGCPADVANAVVTPPARRISTQWSTEYRLPLAEARPGLRTLFVYGAANAANPGDRGSLLSRTQQATDDATGNAGFASNLVGQPRTWTFSYNTNGRLLQVDGPRTDVSDVTTFTYHADNHANPALRGQLATVTNALGHVTSFTAYNNHGQVTSVTDANGLISTFTYDARQRLMSRVTGGETTTYTRRPTGQLASITLPDLTTLTMGYDSAQRLVSTTDMDGGQVLFTLDARGNRIHEEIRDPQGNLVRMVDRAYNAANFLTMEMGGAGQLTTYVRDPEGNPISITGPLNRTVQQAFDPLDRLVGVTQPEPVNGAGHPVITFGYDGMDRITSITDARMLSTLYTHDGLGNEHTRASPDTGITTRTFDQAGNVLSQQDARGVTTTFTYDALGRVTSVQYVQVSGPQLARVDYGYDQGMDALGRLSSITELAADGSTLNSTLYFYDHQGRVVEDRRTAGGVAAATSYAYDAITGQLASMTYPSGRQLHYTYNALGRVRRITATGAGPSQVLVDNVTHVTFGGVSGYLLGNGRMVLREHDLDGRVTGFTLHGVQMGVTYDAAGRVTGIAGGAVADTYSYDGLDRLVGATVAGHQYAYAYDHNGNRLQRTVDGAVENFTVETTSNRITQVSGATTTALTFDNGGNTVTQGALSFTFDARGRMTGATGPSTSAEYLVNALGQRTRKTSGGAETVYVHDNAGHLLAELDPSGATLREYFYLGDMLVSVMVTP